MVLIAKTPYRGQLPELPLKNFTCYDQSRSYSNFGVFLIQVALAWGIKHGIAVIPKSVSENHIKENLEALHVKLDDDDMKAIENIGIRHRYFKMHWIYNNKDIPKDLWDGED